MSLCMKSLAKSKYELKVDNTTQWINCNAVDEYFEMQLCYPLDRVLNRRRHPAIDRRLLWDL